MAIEYDNFGQTEIGPSASSDLELPALPMEAMATREAIIILDNADPGCALPPRKWAETQGDLDQIVKEAADWNVGTNFFGTQERKLNNVLNHTYPLFLILFYRGKDAIAALKKHPSFAGRLRGPNLSNPALAALELVLKPSNKDQRKTCSEYACKLIWANENHIAPEEFQNRCVGISLKEAKAFARKIRRLQKHGSAGKPYASHVKIKIIIESADGTSKFRTDLNDEQYRLLIDGEVASSTQVINKILYEIADNSFVKLS